ncbi:MAG: putative spermidine/putrescine transport system permease protein [Acidimicrobiales bacterium]|jgi:putative spermidine/putrescine transport system permease protein
MKRLFVLACGLLLTGPLLLIPAQAVADEWRAPSLWPQRIGMRGINRVMSDAMLPDAIVNSVIVGCGAAAMALFIGWPAARVLAAQARPSRAALVVFSPLLVPPLVVGEGLQVWFLRIGLADTLFGVMVAHLVYVIPYVVLVLMPAFTGSLREREEAAAGLGAHRRHIWRLVTLPATASSVALAAALGFTVSWSQYGTSLGVGGGIPLLPLVLVPFVRSDVQIAAVLDLVFLVPPLLALLVAWRMTTRPVLV